MKIKIARLAAAALLAMSTTSAFAAGMSDAEFTNTHVGKCVTYKGPSDGVQCYQANGTAIYDDTSYGKDSGTWTFSNGQFCVKWSKESGTACTVYESNGGGQFSGGGYTWTVN